MTIARVQHAENTSAGTSSLVVTGSAMTTGNYVIAWANSDTTVSIAGTAGGTAWSTGPSVVDGNGTYMWYAKIGASPGSTVTFTPSGSTNPIVAGFVEYSGVASAGFDVSGTGTRSGSSNTTSPTASLTPTVTGDVVFAMAGWHGGGTPTGVSGWSAGLSDVAGTVGPAGSGASSVSSMIGELIGAGTSALSVAGTMTGTAGTDCQTLAIALKADTGPTFGSEGAIRMPATDTTGFSTTSSAITGTSNGTSNTQGAVVIVYTASATSLVTSVTYGGTAMTKIVTGTDTSEANLVEIFALTSGVPTGAQTVTINRTGTAQMWAIADTISAISGDNIAVDVSGHTDTTTSTNPTTSITTTDTDIIYVGVGGGAAAPTSYAALSGYTVLFSADYGALSARGYRSTSTVASGSQSVGASYATSDDWTVAAIAFKQTAGGTSKSDTDTGSGTEAVTEVATETAADTGAGTEAVTETAAESSTDTGTGTEASFTKHPDADTGAGAEAATETAAESATDTGTGTEATTETAAESSTDTGHGTEAQTETASESSTDTGTGTESATAGVLAGATDTGAGTEGSTETAAEAAADTGSGADAGIIAGATDTATDTGTGTEATTETASESATETGTATESAVAGQFATSPDTGHGTEAATETASETSSDTGVAAEIAAQLVRQGIVDAGAAAEAAQLAVQQVLAEQGVGTESAAVIAEYVTATETGHGTEAATLDTSGIFHVFDTETGRTADIGFVKTTGPRDEGLTIFDCSDTAPLFEGWTAPL